jgi:hypothetical protein
LLAPPPSISAAHLEVKLMADLDFKF